MVSGGVEKSIINFLNAIDYNTHEVDLYLNRHVGEFYNFIPNQVNLLNNPNNKTHEESYSSTIITPNKGNSIIKLLANSKILQKLGIRNIYYKRKYRSLVLEKRYDIAIVHNVYFNLFYILLNKVNAKFKCAICHGDYGFLNKRTQKEAISYYKKLDEVFFVSKSCEEKFHLLHKNSGVKTGYLYNMQDTEQIIKYSKEEEINYKEGFNIVSVSRLSEEKAHLRTLSVLKSLHDEGHDFCWHVVGEGPMRSKIEEFIANNNMSDYIKLYGNQNNPYPYIKAADLFYLGSYHEAAPMVYAEAMSLGVPVLTTETCSARELVGEYGKVCENSKEGIYQSLKKIITKEVDLTSMRERLKSYSYDNQVYFNKIIK